MTNEDEVAIRQLPGAFDRLTTALHEGSDRWRRVFIGFVIVIAVGMGGNYCQSRSNGRIIAKIDDVTGPEAQKRQAVGTQSVLDRNAIETDCRARRAAAGLPAPLPAPRVDGTLTPAEQAKFLAPFSCVAQTPQDIYPGQPPAGAP